MKKEKKSYSIAVVTAMILFSVIGFGCAANNSGSTSVKVGPDGTNVNAGGVKVQTDNNGVKVDAGVTDRTKVQTSGGDVRVNTGNVDVKTGPDGVEVDM